MFDPATELGQRAKLSNRSLLALGIGAGLFVVFFVVGVVFIVKALHHEPEPTASASAATVVAPATAVATAPPTASAAAPPADAKEAAARAALEKLGEGIKKCVAKTIHVLPGTSRAVPNAFGFLKAPYPPMLNDWSSPFFSCTGFKVDAPMEFAIQWQVDHGSDAGTGIAWIDDDADGKPDRAFAFKATLAKRDVVEIGPIEPVDPSRPMLAR